MSDQDLNAKPADGDEPDPEDAEISALAVDDGKGGKMVPLSALLGAKREARTAGKRVKELEPVAASATELNKRLADAEPYLNTMMTDARIRAEVIARAEGRPVPKADAVDQEALDEAIDQGWYQADQVTPDVAKARRVLDRHAGIAKRATDEAMRPLGAMTVNAQAERHYAQVLGMRDDNDVPYASEESIREVAQMLGPELMANPKVVNTVITQAIGVDRMKGRTPKAPDEPLFLASNARGPRQPLVSDDERRIGKRVGLDDKELEHVTNELARSGGRGMRME